MASKMLHICYRVKDLEASKKFYMDLFNFEVSREKDYPEEKFTLSYLVAPGEDFELELTYNYDSDGYTIGDGYSHLAIGVDDLEAAYEEAQKSGYEMTEFKSISGGKTKYFFITDPDGYRVEVMQNR